MSDGFLAQSHSSKIVKEENRRNLIYNEQLIQQFGTKVTGELPKIEQEAQLKDADSSDSNSVHSATFKNPVDGCPGSTQIGVDALPNQFDDMMKVTRKTSEENLASKNTLKEEEKNKLWHSKAIML